MSTAVVTKKTQPDKAAERDEDAAAASIERDDKDRREAVLQMADDHEAKTKGHIPPKGKAAKKGSTKAKAATKVEGSAKASNRLTSVWPSKSGKDVQIKDKVKLKDGATATCVGRWSKHLKDGGLVPMITGTTADGTRKNSPAAEVTHTK